ncbi:hypothetical protein BHM03_00051001, partial [Ensete ventricosum]
VRGIANSKDSELMQGLVHGRQSVHGHPKFSMLLDPEGVTQEWVDEGELPREQTKNRRWRRPNDVLAEATRGEVVV